MVNANTLFFDRDLPNDTSDVSDVTDLLDDTIRYYGTGTDTLAQ